MAGGSAMIRHDSGSALHDRNPVGIGRLGDQNRAVLEIRYVGGAADHAGPTRRNRASDRGPRGEDLSLLLQPIVSESGGAARSEEHTSELQSLMRISYAVFCLKKKKYINKITKKDDY